ncbi:MAG: hypothetical protein Q9213_002177 [Squamulea squamosa]
MEHLKYFEPKSETNVASTDIGSSHVLETNVRPIRSGDFASKDEQELAAQGKKQQTRVRFEAHWMPRDDQLKSTIEELWLRWQSTIAWQAAVASSSFLSGTIIQGMLVLSYPSYTFEPYHGTLLLYAVLVVALIFNTFLGKYLPFVESSILVLHVVGVFVIMIPIVYLSPQKSSAHEVFTLFLDTGGYNNKGLAFFVGIIATIFSFVGM